LAGTKWNKELFDKNAVDGKVSKSLFEQAAKNINNRLEDKYQIRVGDVVQAKAPDEALFFEGVRSRFVCSLVYAHPLHLLVQVVMELHTDGACDIDFGDGDGEYPRCSMDNIRKVMSWDELEIGDHVKVKYQGGCQQFEAVVIADNKDSTYNVKYDDDEVEEKVPRDLMTKIMSHRIDASAHWSQLRNVVRGAAFLVKAAAIEEGKDAS
jgi:hypothetical protein